jgi:hypothetical protein
LVDKDRYKQDNQVLFNVAQKILIENFNILNPREKEVWSLALLGFSKKGLQVENCPRMHKLLKPNDFVVFMSIFANNNKEDFISFLTNDLTRKLWPIVVSQMTMADTFKKDKVIDADMFKTY